MRSINRRGRNFSSSPSPGKGGKGNRSNAAGRSKNNNSSSSRRTYKPRSDETALDNSLRQGFVGGKRETRSSSSSFDGRNSNRSTRSNYGYLGRSNKQKPFKPSNQTDEGYLNSKNVRFDYSKNVPPRENHQNINSFDDNHDSHLFDENHSNDIYWGRHATQAILESGRPIHRIWCTSELRSSQRFFQLLRDSKSSGVLVEEVSWARLGHITHGGVHQGIALQTAASETLVLQTLINGCSELGEHPILLALDGLTDPHNVGAIVRSAEAFGAHGLILPQRRTAGLTGSVAKVAAGALEHLPVARVINLNRSLEELKKSGYTVIGLAEEGDLILNEVVIDGPLVLVIGSEGKGLSLLTRRNCDQLVRIPLRGVTSSLNASVASSVFLYEIAKKSWMKGMTGQAPSPKKNHAKLSNQPFNKK